MRKTSLPRHAAGSMELKEGTGPITAICPCGKFLEIYKGDKTFRILTPEGVDPDETNPNAPWVAAPVDDVGSRNPIVSRVLLQSHEFLKSALFKKPVDTESVTLQLHNCKESLIACDKVATRVAAIVENIIEKVKAEGISADNRGRGLNPFPYVPDLETECATFLIHANRAIKDICELPMAFIDLDHPDSNFDFLAKRLTAVLGADASLSKFVSSNADGIRYLVDLRNFHEHPKSGARTVIENFRLMPDMKINVPMWHVSGNQPRPIKDEMRAAVDFLVEMSEVMLIHLVMATVVDSIPFIVEKFAEAEINPDNPMRYRLSIDASKLRLQSDDPTIG
jgi:hypothetical protein